MHDFLKDIDNTWTLFLDRDGVLNHEIKGDYVRNVSQLKIYDYVPQTIAKCNTLFNKIIVITNQRGVGKGLYSNQDVNKIHEYINTVCKKANGKIDAFYFSTDLENEAENRKPNIGLALQAIQDFPNIDFNKSIMIGNNISDMQFGKKAGMKTIFVETTSIIELPNQWVDLVKLDLKHVFEY
jgi:histidinol-phosphate phosphatase family protein